MSANIYYAITMAETKLAAVNGKQKKNLLALIHAAREAKAALESIDLYAEDVYVKLEQPVRDAELAAQRLIDFAGPIPSNPKM